MNREEVVRRLQELAQKLGKETLTQQDIRRSSYISEYWIRKHFKTLASALEAAGLQPSKLAIAMATSNDELLDYLADLQRRLHRQPTGADIDRDGRFSRVIFRKRFGSMQEALRRLKDRTLDQQLSAGRFEAGPAAEYLVVAELLYRGFNANRLPVDTGIDIIALKGNKAFNIQVKNISFKEGKPGNVAITVSAYERHRASDVYYIFVLNREHDRHFLILPFHKIDELIDNRVIQSKDRAPNKYRFNVLWHEDRVYINELSERAEVTIHLDAWEKIV